MIDLLLKHSFLDIPRVSCLYLLSLIHTRDHGEEWKYSARPSNSTHAETVFVNSRIVRVSVENEILKERFASIFSTTCDSFGPQTRFNILIEPVLYPGERDHNDVLQVHKSILSVCSK